MGVSLTIDMTPDVTQVTVSRHGWLRLTFADGLTGEANVLGRMRGPVFEPVRSTAGFAQVLIDREVGTVVWPNGANLAPDTLYYRIRQGHWPDEPSRRWRIRLIAASVAGAVRRRH